MLGELLSVCRRNFGLRPNFLKLSQNSHFNYNDPALKHLTTVGHQFPRPILYVDVIYGWPLTLLIVNPNANWATRGEKIT